MADGSKPYWSQRMALAFENIVPFADDPTFVVLHGKIFEARHRLVFDRDRDSTRRKIIYIAAELPCEERVKSRLFAVILTCKAAIVVHLGSLVLPHE